MNASKIADEMCDVFARDGVVKVPGLVDPAALTGVMELAQRQLDDPGRWVTDTNPGSTTDRLFTTRYQWRNESAMNNFVFGSGVAQAAADIMSSESVRIYFDHLLVKEPSTDAPTPWHQDIPYWPFMGKQICSVWVSCTSTTVAESSLEFVRGSHLWDAYYAPEGFDSNKDNDWTRHFEGERCPDIGAARDDYDIVGFDVEPGDAIIFSAWILHGAPGNCGDRRRVAVSTRWLGDDATWFPHAGADPIIGQADTTLSPGEYPGDDHCFPVGSG